MKLEDLKRVTSEAEMLRLMQSYDNELKARRSPVIDYIFENDIDEVLKDDLADDLSLPIRERYRRFLKRSEREKILRKGTNQMLK